jgi:hypothetical protein
MTGNYSTKLQNPARKVTAEAHNGPIDVTGMTIAHVSDEFKIQKLETFYDPAAIFDQLAPSEQRVTEYLSEGMTDTIQVTGEIQHTDSSEKVETTGKCPFRPGAGADITTE